MKKTGFTLVEAVVSVAVIGIVLVSLSGVSAFLTRASNGNTAKIQALFLAEEGIEIMRILRDQGWTTNIASISLNSPFYLSFTGGNWQKSATNVFIDGLFERKVTLESVQRDSSSNIVSSGGTVDPNIKKIIVSVSWSTRGATTTKSLSTYLANNFND